MRKSFAGLVATMIVLVMAVSAMSVIAAKPSPVKTPLVSEPAADVPLENAEWTIIVYLAADNNLETMGLSDLDEMEKVGSVDGVNVVVLMDTLTATEGTHWYFVGANQNHIDLESGLNDCDCEEVAGGCPGELNMGNPETLTYCLEKAIAFAPAENYMLVLWDHGGGWWGVCYDESSLLPSGSMDRLTMDEVQRAVKAAKQPSGEPVELAIIGYDACFMGMVEVAYENRDLADYMVASITTVPGPGWDYTQWLSGIQKTDKSAFEVSKKAADTYVEFYDICAGAGLGGYPFTSMGVFDLKEVPALVMEGIAPLAEELEVLTAQYYLRGLIQSSESQTPQIQFHGEAFPFTDIGWYVTLLGEKIPDLNDECTAVFDLLMKAVPYYVYVAPDSDMSLRSYGMSIYFTMSSDKLYANYLTSGLDLVDDTLWDEFLWDLVLGP